MRYANADEAEHDIRQRLAFQMTVVERRSVGFYWLPLRCRGLPAIAI
jgi:hypothetical protein